MEGQRAQRHDEQVNICRMLLLADPVGEGDWKTILSHTQKDMLDAIDGF